MEKENTTMIAKTLTGLENVLASELEALGAENVKPQKRAVQFDGDTELMYKANLWSRAALSILKPVFEFTFESQQQYYDILHDHPWDDIFDVKKTIAINAMAFNSEFTNSLFLAQRTKDAIADFFTEKAGSRPNVDLEDPQIKLNIYITGNHCSVSLDSSGAPLFKRGYRRKNVPAPINEVLAAGLIMLAGWDKKKPFYDPMCGSATFSIEAAMMALNMAPSIFRRGFSFQHWKDYDAELWETLRENARQAELKTVPEIIASDINNNAMDAARHNLMEAGLLGRVKLEKKDFFNSKPAHDNGMVIINPPYGRRLHSDDIHNYYKDIGTALKHNFTGFEAWIISPDNALTHKIGLRHSSQTLVFNGQLECKFLGYDLYPGTKKIHKTEEGSQERRPYQRTENRSGSSTEKRSFDSSRRKPDSRSDRKPYKRTEGKSDDKEERRGYNKPGSRPEGRPERKPYKRREDRNDSPGEKRSYNKPDDRSDNRTERKPHKRGDNQSENRSEKRDFKKADGRTERKPYQRRDSKPDKSGEKRTFKKPWNKPDKNQED